MSRDDELACMIHALQERCEELEARVSFLEDEVSIPELPPVNWVGEIEEDEDDDDNEYSAVRSPRGLWPLGRGEVNDADVG